MINQSTAHAIITGGSSGIGLACARQLAQQGVSITLIARGKERLDNAIAELERLRIRKKQRFLAFPADVGNKTEVQHAIQQAIEIAGAPDYLITSAGIARPGHFEELPEQVFEETMRINYFGTLYAVQAVVPAMRARRQGHIVLVSSGAGLIGLFGYTAYSPTKFAVRGLAEALQAELRPHQIHVSIAYPPDTETPQLEEENKYKPIETRRMTEMAQVWTADAVANCILKGIEAKQFAIAPGWMLWALNRFNGLVTPLLFWHFDRLIAREKIKLPY